MLALASTEALLQRVPMFAEDKPLLEAVALLLRPAYALAGTGPFATVPACRPILQSDATKLKVVLCTSLTDLCTCTQRVHQPACQAEA